jgi:potassium efflux system protein
MVATSILAYRLFHPKKGLELNLKHGLAPALLRRTRGAWHALCSAIPLVLAGCAAVGYTYMASQFALRIVETVLWIQGLVLFHALLYRWIVLSQRRLAIKVALEKRQAQERSRESSALEESQEAILDMLDEIDVAEVKEQTLDILRITVGFLLLLGLWISWAGVVPALGVLQTVDLWHHSVVVEGESVLQPVTLWNVLVSILFLILTIAAARNMPGFLEITLLQRLPMDPGNRYATRTIVLYVIVTTGVVLTFNALGIGWSSVQWLVAALTVGLGFGLQEIFANFVSGVILLIERPIRVGDTVTVGTISGVVTRIRMRATTITDWNRKELIVPNRNFITGELINWSLLDPILRMDFTVGIAYGSDTILAQQVMLNVCREHSRVLKTPEPDVFFVGFGDNSLNFEVRVFVAEQTNSGRTRIIHDLHMGIDRACRENHITIAFPQRDLHLKTADALVRVVNVRDKDAPNAPVAADSVTTPTEAARVTNPGK